MNHQIPTNCIIMIVFVAIRVLRMLYISFIFPDIFEICFYMGFLGLFFPFAPRFRHQFYLLFVFSNLKRSLYFSNERTFESKYEIIPNSSLITNIEKLLTFFKESGFKLAQSNLPLRSVQPSLQKITVPSYCLAKVLM